MAALTASGKNHRPWRRHHALSNRFEMGSGVDGRLMATAIVVGRLTDRQLGDPGQLPQRQRTCEKPSHSRRKVMERQTLRDRSRQLSVFSERPQGGCRRAESGLHRVSQARAVPGL